MHEDDLLLIEDWLVRPGMMPAKGCPSMRPQLLPPVVETLNCAANIRKYHALTIGHGRSSGVVIKEAGEVCSAAAWYFPTPELVPGFDIKA